MDELGNEFEYFKRIAEEQLNRSEAINKKIEEDAPEAKEISRVQGVDLIRLDGVAIREDGKITRSQFFEFLDEVDQNRNDIVLTKEEALKLRNTYAGIRVGLNSVVPMICSGNKCPFKSTCVFFEIGKHPLGKRCPVETEFLRDATVRLLNEFQVDPENYTELMLVQELAEILVYERRATMTLSKEENAELYGEHVAYDKEGNEIVTEVIHWAVDLKEKYKTRRLKILSALNATRKDKAAALKNTDNGNSYANEVRNVLNAIKKFNMGEEVKFEVDDSK